MAVENQYGKSAVDATRRNALPPYLDQVFENGLGTDIVIKTVTLYYTQWNLNVSDNKWYQTVTVEEVGDSSIILVFPDQDNMKSYLSAGIFLSESLSNGHNLIFCSNTDPLSISGMGDLYPVLLIAEGEGSSTNPIIIDTALSLTSTNPVQNKVITAALDTKAPLASPNFTGSPTAPTQDSLTDDTSIATTEFVHNLVDSIVASGGHIILNPSGTAMAARPNLQFTGSGVSVSDDSSNNKTVVTIEGGGGSSGVQTAYFQTSIVLNKDNWQNNLQTIAVESADAQCPIFVTAADEDSRTSYIDAKIEIHSQQVGSITFSCEEVPTTNINLKILLFVNAGVDEDTINNAIGNYISSQQSILNSANWSSDLEYTLNISLVNSQSIVLVEPTQNSKELYENYGISCISQGEGFLTFKCETTPTEDISINILILAGVSDGVQIVHNAQQLNGHDSSYYAKASELVKMNLLTNTNLLTNWYFKGGGNFNSFPINQRQKETYSSDIGEAIFDRWRAYMASATLSTDYVTFLGTSGSGGGIFQNLEKNELPMTGTTVTLSCLDNNNNLYYGNGQIGTDFSVPLTGGVELTYKAAAPLPQVAFMTDIGDSINIVAVKFEIGSYQTLAHKENNQWVLNEIPNYSNELNKCQRYLFISKDNDYLYLIGQNIGITWNGQIPCPSVMKKEASVVFGDLSLVVVPEGNIHATSQPITYSTSDGIICVQISMSSTLNNPILRLRTNYTISAEI